MLKKGINSGFFILIFLLACSNSHHEQTFGSGTLEATEVLVRSQSVGEILSIHVQEGDQVKTRDIIAQIDTTKLNLQREQLLAGLQEFELNIQNVKKAVSLAKDQFENTDKKYQRVKALYEEKSTTEQQFDDVSVAYKAALTQLETTQTNLNALYAKRKQLTFQLDLLETQIDDATINSPISGVVINKYVEEGELANLGTPIVSVADLENMWIRVYLTTKEIGNIKLGASVKLVMDALPEKSFAGTVSWISPKAEFTPKNVQTKEARADLVYAVKVETENKTGELKIGMPGDVIF